MAGSTSPAPHTTAAANAATTAAPPPPLSRGNGNASAVDAAPSRGAPSPRTIDELDEAISRLASRINAGSYRLLVLVREFDDRMGWAKWCFASCAEWLAWRCGLSLSAAREKVRTAHALRDLPAIAAAFARGRLSYSKVRALTRVAGSLCDEAPLLRFALEATAAQVEERCRQIRNVAPESAAEAQRAWERRSLSICRNPGRGTLTISVELPVEEGEVIARAIDRAVEVGEVEQGPEFGASGWQAQQADGLVVLAKSYLAGVSGVSGVSDAGVSDASDGAAERAADSRSRCHGAAASMPVADHYQVIVHVDEAALRGGAGQSDLPIETIRRLTCDGSLVTVVEDGCGTPLDVGRKQRTVSVALRRALWARDRGCTYPGCHRKHFVDAHHILHWINGGESTLENTTLMCTYHHRLLHEGAFRLRRDHEGEIYFQRPDGRVIPRGGYRAEDVLDDMADDVLDHARDEVLDEMPGEMPGEVLGDVQDDVLREGSCVSGGESSPDAIAFSTAVYGDGRTVEQRLAAIVHGRKPSAEVREPAAVYLVAQRLAGRERERGRGRGRGRGCRRGRGRGTRSPQPRVTMDPISGRCIEEGTP